MTYLDINILYIIIIEDIKKDIYFNKRLNK